MKRTTGEAYQANQAIADALPRHTGAQWKLYDRQARDQRKWDEHQRIMLAHKVRAEELREQAAATAAAAIAPQIAKPRRTRKAKP